MTHYNPLVNDAAIVYGQTIAYLLNHADDENKITEAFDHAKTISERLEAEFQDESV